MKTQIARLLLAYSLAASANGQTQSLDGPLPQSSAPKWSTGFVQHERLRAAASEISDDSLNRDFYELWSSSFYKEARAPEQLTPYPLASNNPIAVVKFDRQGTVHTANILRSSGVPLYDELLLLLLKEPKEFPKGWKEVFGERLSSLELIAPFELRPKTDSVLVRVAINEDEWARFQDRLASAIRYHVQGLVPENLPRVTTLIRYEVHNREIMSWTILRSTGLPDADEIVERALQLTRAEVVAPPRPSRSIRHLELNIRPQ